MGALRAVLLALTMNSIGICVMMLLLINHGAGSAFGRRRQAKPDIFPMEIAISAEELASQKGTEATSLLLLDLGSGLTLGSLNSNASFLSSRPFLSKRFLTLEVHTVLREALAAPLRIIVIVSLNQCLQQKHLFENDFVQNIRHKLLFLILIATGAQDKKLQEEIIISPLPTIVWSENAVSRSWCFENRDNLIRRRVPKPIAACDSTISTCKFKDLTERPLLISGSLLIGYTLKVTCNTTEAKIHYKAALTPKNEESGMLISKSLWNLADVKASNCYSFIPFSHVDVSALLKPFDLRVWFLIVSNVLLLAAAWSSIVRGSKWVFSGQIFFSIITVRQVGLSPQTFSATVICCVALIFTFLIGHLYSICVMSSLLDPTFRLPPTHPVEDCRMTLYCYSEDSLEFKLENAAVCRIPPHMLASVTRPLRRFKPLIPYEEETCPFISVESIVLRLQTKSITLPLVLTQNSTIWERILQHGMLSPARLDVLEVKYLLASATDDKSARKSKERNQMRWLRAEKWFDEKLQLEYVSFNTTREWFDMHSFLKILPIFGFCILSIVAAICFEFFWDDSLTL